MKRVILFIVIVCALAIIPTVSFTEDSATVRLARTIYTLASDCDQETKLAIGTVVMNRVESPWYPATLEGVLAQQQQFPCGTRYDEASLQAAHDVLSGKRVLDSEAIAYQANDAAAPRGEKDKCAELGRYSFYTSEQK